MEIQINCLNYVNHSKKCIIMKLEQKKTIKEILLEEKINPETIKSVTFFVNGAHQRSDYIVQDGDVITVIPIVVGG